MVFLKSGGRAGNYRSDPKNMIFLDGRLPLPESTSPEKVLRKHFSGLYSFSWDFCIIFFFFLAQIDLFNYFHKVSI